MDQAAAADADRRHRPAAPPHLHAAAGNIGSVRPRRDDEQESREDKEPEIMNTERFHCHFHVTIISWLPRHRPNGGACQSCTDCSTIPPDRPSARCNVFYKHWNRSADHVVVIRPFGRLWGYIGEMERRLAAIVCADVAGYSRMMGADEAGTHATFKAHRTAMYPIILNHGGRLVKNTGDGFLLEFPSIVGAIEAAIAMQMMMAERNSTSPPTASCNFESASIWAM